MKVLVKFNSSSKIITVENASELTAKIEEKFFITSFTLKRYDKEFEEYVDVDELDDIHDMDKLMIDGFEPLNTDEPKTVAEAPIVNNSISTFSICTSKSSKSKTGSSKPRTVGEVPIVNNSISSFSISTSKSSKNKTGPSKPRTVGEVPIVNNSISSFSICTSKSSKNKTGSSKNTSSSDTLNSFDKTDTSIPSSLCLKKPSYLQVAENQFSASLKEALNDKIPLSPALRKELVWHLAWCLTDKHTMYPLKKEKQSLCIDLVTKYPHLKDYSMFGIQTWGVRISNKLKKMRMSSNSMEVITVKARTLRSMPEGCRKFRLPAYQQIPGNIRKPGVINWAPNHLPGENLATLATHKKLMQIQTQKEILDKSTIESLMARTFSFRRAEINMNAPVITLLRDYPFFFIPDFQLREFERLTTIDLSEIFIESVLIEAPKLLSLGKLAPEKEHLSPSDKLEAQAELGLKLLPKLLREELDSFYKEETEETKVELLDPHPIILHSDGDYSIVVQNQTVTRIDNFLSAICLMMSYYYTLNIKFPNKLKNSLIFIQIKMIGIYAKHIPPIVQTLMKKLERITY